MTARWWILAGAGAVFLGLAAFIGWRELHRAPHPDWIVSSNGRLEAQRIDIASKIPGRIAEVLVDEGQMVDAGAILARLDASEIEAQLRAGEAQARRAEEAVGQAEHQIALLESVRTLTRKEFDRASALRPSGAVSAETLDISLAERDAAEAAYLAGLSQLSQAKAAVDAAQADVVRIKSILTDAVLRAPLRGRIEYKLTQPGEVVGPGSRVLTLINLTDVYMTIFLPASTADQLAVGDESRLILDPWPQYVAPATVSFVAPEAQFTPKSVETAEEREKLMFRVKLKLPPELLQKFESQVKAGVRGVGFVRTRRDMPWPTALETKLPP